MKKRDKGIFAVAGAFLTFGAVFLMYADITEAVDGLVVTEEEAKEHHDHMRKDSTDAINKQSSSQAAFNAYFLEQAVEQDIEILKLQIEAEEDEDDEEELKSALKRKQNFRASMEEQKQLNMTANDVSAGTEDADE